MQEAIAEDVKTAGSGIGAFINVKPSLLLDGEGKGLEKVRIGTEDEPAVGYTIQRGDVGKFIFERLINVDMKAEWLNTALTITY